ncbi:hypothetical protein HPP92_011481 [Vanilla planifolia]|uniref:D-glycerate 3-kinase, chloroplastic n=1 Tax=Vanilla planifolia TaxID=51239 RepID=A0A835V0S8_VANPL|nr:hypothetical protein HPP92_011481 [Vanilla planifolia]
MLAAISSPSPSHPFASAAVSTIICADCLKHTRTKLANLSTLPVPSSYAFSRFRSRSAPALLPVEASLADIHVRYTKLITFRSNPLHCRHLATPRPSFTTSPALVSSVDDLFGFICSGPLLKRLGLTAEKVANGIDKWLLYGGYLCRLFGMSELILTPSEKEGFTISTSLFFLWCEEQIHRHVSQVGGAEEGPTPLMIGVSAPQGSGKTTLVFALEYLFRQSGRNAATLSIDDFYLTAEEQLRGNAGSHDLQLSVKTLTALKGLTKAGMKMKLPRYDKSAYGGRGDRADPSTWPEVEGPLSVILFEGWMLGFKPIPGNAVKAVDPQLEVINKNLEAYYDAWDKFVDAWIIIKIKDPNNVYRWRLQAEVAMREDGKPGMSDEEVMDFVSRYLPAYKAYLPTLYSEGPQGLDKERLVLVEIDEERNPLPEE